MKILVDMDDVIEDLLGAWTEFLNSKYGFSVKRDDVAAWDMRIAYPLLSTEEIYSPLSSEELWKTVEPFPDAVEYIQKLMQEHEVFIVTASHYNNVLLKMKNVLVKYFPFIPYENVIITYKKQMVIGDVLIDDRPENLIGGTYKKLLFNAPHNRNYDPDAINKHGMIRVKDWKEIYSIISKMNECD